MFLFFWIFGGGGAKEPGLEVRELETKDITLFLCICGGGIGANEPGSEERRVETGALVTKVAGGQGVGHAATERDGDRVGAAGTSVLEHLETWLMYCSLRITVWLQYRQWKWSVVLHSLLHFEMK